MFSKFFSKKNEVDSKFSRFFREASSREKKKVFNEVIRKATEEQQKIINEAVHTKNA